VEEKTAGGGDVSALYDGTLRRPLPKGRKTHSICSSERSVESTPERKSTPAKPEEEMKEMRDDVNCSFRDYHDARQRSSSR
jgi:hypothetical protein